MPFSRRFLGLGAAALGAVGALGLYRRLGRGGPPPLSDALMAERYARPLPPPAGPLNVFHLGHSLVGRDIPSMVEQLAGSGHEHASQLGWGTSLREHWEPDLPINGFATENDHPNHRDARAALASGAFDAFVMTEMVELRDAIRYHDSAEYLYRWARHAHDANPGIRLFLYETWHHIDDPDGWLARLDSDYETLWQQEILRRALARDGLDAPIHVIPAGQVFARFIRAAAAQGGVDGIAAPADLFKIDDDGTQDTIHLNDQGKYLAALTHLAVLYQRDPSGSPRRLRRADGAAAQPPGPQAARLMQDSVWDVVTREPLTGLPRATP